MSEEGGFIDVESDEVPELGGEATATTSNNGDALGEEYSTDKRAHHNLLERRRRDHIKDSFHGLRDCIPSLQGEKVSRAHILNKATEYIRQMQRGGSMREGEIKELKKKNEILEEQVRAIEQNKALGSNQKIEEILETVARQVQLKQKQKDTQQEKAVQGTSKAEKPTIDLSGRDISRGISMTTRTTPTTVGSGTDPKRTETLTQSSSNALNLLHLAGNLKNAQALLSALQKNLPPNATLANVKSLASKVAAPSRQGTVTAASSLPRGIVTATTVPKGSSLPLNLASALQQKPTGTTPVLVGKPSTTSQTANHLSSQLKPTSTPPTQQTNVPKTSTTGSGTGSASLQEEKSQGSNANAASQLLEASSLLQQQGGGGGDMGGASGAIPSLTAEIIAQCFLNLPNSSVSPSGDGESVAMSTTEATVSAANVLAALGSLTQASDSNNHLKVQAPPTSSTPLTPHPTHVTPSTQADTSTNQHAEEDSSDVPPSAKRPKLES